MASKPQPLRPLFDAREEGKGPPGALLITPAPRPIAPTPSDDGDRAVALGLHEAALLDRARANRAKAGD